LWVVLDECFGHREPYEVRGRDLREFAATWHGDIHANVDFIWHRVPRVALIHHEGAFAHILIAPNSIDDLQT
jgi:hypothetical protein